MICFDMLTDKNGITITDSEGFKVTDTRLSYLFDFMLEPSDHFKVAWNLNDFVAPLLALLPADKLDKLFATQRIWISPYGITYFPDKVLILVKGSYRARIYNLKQYFKDETLPATPQEAAKLGEGMLAELETISVYPESLSSPVTMIIPQLKAMNLPYHLDCPDEVNIMAEELRGQTWTEAHQLGHWDKTFDYDQTAAYASPLSELLDLRKGKWIHSIACPAGAVYGFAKANLKITSDISPIIYANANRNYFSPKGSWQDIISKQNIDLIKEYNLGSVDILDGWWWIPQTEEKPLYNLIHQLFDNRSISPLLSRICKRMANSIYGKTLEVFKDSGKPGYFYNPVWGATIEAEVKVKVARFIFDNNLEKNVIHISTDGVLLDKEVAIPEANGMGSWRLDAVSPALVVGSSTVFFSDKRPHQVAYPDAMAMIQADPDAEDWGMETQRRVTLGDVVLGYEGLGKMLDIHAGFRLPYEHDREFDVVPNSGRDLLSRHFTSKAIARSKLS